MVTNQRFAQLQDWELLLVAAALHCHMSDKAETIRAEILETLRDRKAKHD